MFVENKNKEIYFTLDLEQDYGRINDYSSFKNIDRLINLFKKYDLKLTVFITGNIIEQKPEIIEKIKGNINCEFHLHSYNHEINRTLSYEERREDLIRAVDVYKKYFGKNPIGWRSPCGNIIKGEINWLKNEGFIFSSSVIPTYRPGLYNNLNQSEKPFIYPNGLLEIPMSSLPFIKMPFSLSYFQLLGWPISHLLINNKDNNGHLVFGFHLHNLSKLDDMRQLKIRFCLGYMRNQNNGFQILEKFIQTTKERNYRSELMTELAGRELNY